MRLRFTGKMFWFILEVESSDKNTFYKFQAKPNSAKWFLSVEKDLAITNQTPILQSLEETKLGIKACGLLSERHTLLTHSTNR